MIFGVIHTIYRDIYKRYYVQEYMPDWGVPVRLGRAGEPGGDDEGSGLLPYFVLRSSAHILDLHTLPGSPVVPPTPQLCPTKRGEERREKVNKNKTIIWIDYFRYLLITPHKITV